MSLRISNKRFFNKKLENISVSVAHRNECFKYFQLDIFHYSTSIPEPSLELNFTTKLCLLLFNKSFAKNKKQIKTTKLMLLSDPKFIIEDYTIHVQLDYTKWINISFRFQSVDF
jgi:hypothetical protein